ncbi:MAG: hypothetical protein JOY95_13355 [Silvibacterium sp.]|nr:hypothetical protein [Silvibacterium sp.]
MPDDLIAEIDLQVGPRRRSAFLVEVARAELRRRRLLNFLESKDPAWKTEDHPEIGENSAEWVKGLRAASDARMPSESRLERGSVRRTRKVRKKAG